ncbi:MAG: NAD(P)/FAD-dependent oxidoreductase [Phycisphaerales bacterium]
MSDPHAQLDLVIVGGGIAGLWTMRRLEARGFSVALVESRALGAGQSVASQGIIHGGAKYALGGAANRASEAVRDMPRVWRECLEGHGAIDLRAVPILAERQILFSVAGLASKLLTRAAAQVTRGPATRLEPAEYPAFLPGNAYRGVVVALDEPVLDAPAVIAELARGARGPLLEVAAEDGWFVESSDAREGVRLRLRAADGRGLTLEAKRVVFTAGTGNEPALDALGFDAGRTAQRRPLHMVFARGAALPDAWAHAVDRGSTPRVTITTHRDDAGTPVWYLGGEIAESGVARTEIEQVHEASKRIEKLFRWIDFSEVEWSTLRVDRAEPRTADGRRPEEPALSMRGGGIVGWPSKLALAPRLASMIEEALAGAQCAPTGVVTDERGVLDDWPRPAVATPPWKEPREWRLARSVDPDSA